MIIASFPKGSYPEYTWPIGTWPAAPEAAVDIQYTEIMEFAVCIATSAEFDVILPNDASVDVVSTDIIVSGAGNAAVNGAYDYQGVKNGKAWYYKADADMGFQWISAPGNYWTVNNIYKSYDDVATPDLCTTWELGLIGGIEPFPTVTAGTTPTLTEVAIFTLEMPQIIEIEVYEELSL